MEAQPLRPSKRTAKGERTRASIVAEAARLIHERGVAKTTLDDVKEAAAVSSSQLYHYFADKDELVQAVIEHQAELIVDNQRRADLSSIEGRKAWRDSVIAQVTRTEGRGGCPLGSLGGQLAEIDPRARALIAGGFERWAAAIADDLGGPPQGIELPAAVTPDDLAVTLLAAIQGSLVLSQVERSARPLETVVDTLLSLAGV